jgi:hypothetical protein
VLTVSSDVPLISQATMQYGADDREWPESEVILCGASIRFFIPSRRRKEKKGQSHDLMQVKRRTY